MQAPCSAVSSTVSSEVVDYPLVLFNLRTISQTLCRQREICDGEGDTDQPYTILKLSCGWWGSHASVQEEEGGLHPTTMSSAIVWLQYSATADVHRLIYVIQRCHHDK